MYVTEEEARKKWCPNYRCLLIHQGHSASVNHFYMPGKGPHRPRCIASGCMMWREAHPSKWPHPTNEQNWESGRTGYCGLAGRPE